MRPNPDAPPESAVAPVPGWTAEAAPPLPGYLEPSCSGRRIVRGAGLFTVCVAILLAAAASGAARAATALERLPAEGLIVRLKGSPEHWELRRDATAAQAAGERWRALLVREPGRPQPTAWRAVGRDQVLLGFERALTAAEAEAAAARLRSRPDVEWVAPNVREPLHQAGDPTPADPMFPQQWWLQTVQGSNAQAQADRRRGVPGFLDTWASGLPGAFGAPGAVVAVLDTGVTRHPELEGRLLPGRDFVRDDTHSADGQPGRDDDPTDPGDGTDGATASAGCAAASTWHGTSVAGLLVARSDNGSGVAGALREGRVLPVRVAGRCGATVADIIDGMRWAAGLEVDGHRNPWPARVINISFGGTSACGREYQDTIDELRALGVVVVAAAGNEPGRVTRPASCRGVVGVVALNRDGFKTRYSGFGPELAASGIATVGGDDASGTWGSLLGDGGLVTLGNTGRVAPGEPGYVAVYGTSYAAPLVAATAALMLAVDPGLGVDQVVAGLGASARPHLQSTLLPACSAAEPGRCICDRMQCGVGVLDVRQALQYAQGPASYVPVAWPHIELAAGALETAVALGPDGGVQPAALVAPADPPDAGGGALAPWWLVGLLAAVAALRVGRGRA